MVYLSSSSCDQICWLAKVTSLCLSQSLLSVTPMASPPALAHNTAAHVLVCLCLPPHPITPPTPNTPPPLSVIPPPPPLFPSRPEDKGCLPLDVDNHCIYLLVCCSSTKLLTLSRGRREFLWLNQHSCKQLCPLMLQHGACRTAL